MSDDFQTHELPIITRELSAGGFARYLRLYRSGRGNYTRDRHQWLDGITMEEILEDMKALERRSETSSA